MNEKAYYIFCHAANEPREWAVEVLPDNGWIWNSDPTLVFMFWADDKRLNTILRKTAVWVDELHLTVTVVEI